MPHPNGGYQANAKSGYCSTITYLLSAKSGHLQKRSAARHV